MLKGLYRRLSHPLGVEKPSQELKEAIRVLDWDLMAWQVISASIILMLLTFLVIMPIFILLMLQRKFVSASMLLVIPILVYLFFTEYPKYLAKSEKSKEIGEIPIFISELVILLKQNPNVEKALTTLSNLEGKIFKKLRSKLLKLKVEGGSGKSVLMELASEHENHFPEFRRAVSLILNGEFERGLKICMEGVSNKIEEFSNNLTLPTLILFSIGAVFPLVFISLLPMISFVSFDFLSLLLVILVSSLFVFLYSNYVLSKRPLVFPIFELNKRVRFNLFWYILICVIVSIPSIPYLLSILGIKTLLFPEGYNSIWFLLGITSSIVIFSYNYSKETIEEKKYVESMEIEASNLSYKLASLAVEGKPLDKEVSKINFSVSNRMRILGHLIKNSIQKGSEKLYEVLTNFGDYFSKIDSIRESYFNKIDNVISMMKLTAVLFLPLVSAIAISIAYEISKNTANVPFLSFSMNLDALVFLSGIYTLITSILLLRYIIYLKNGVDKVELCNALYKNLPIAMGLFVILYSLLPEVI